MAETFSRDSKAGRIEGSYDPKFKSVVDTFVENFETRDEVGANVAITLEGRTVVDLWGGRKARDGGGLRFEYDRTIEHKIAITASPDGFLKRV